MDQQHEMPILHAAILQRNEASIRQCLDRGCDINESDSSGRTPLHLSILQKDQRLFTHLLKERRADVGLYDGKGLSAIHLAAIHDHEGLFLETLIAEGADANARSTTHPRPTPLESAIKANNLLAFKILLKAKADPTDGLHTAAKHDTEGLFLQTLIDAGANVNYLEGYPPLRSAIEAKNLKAIQILLKAGAKCSESDLEKLNEAAFASIHAILPKKGLKSRL